MKLRLMIGGLLCCALAPAWAADAAPPNATGQCKDGTYTTAAHHRGACTDHGGVKSWFGDKATAPATEPSSAAEAPKANRPSSSTATTERKPPMAAAGQVWVNTKSHVYHCSGDRWYGKTKHGEYMSESEAKAKGNRPDHNKTCTA